MYASLIVTILLSFILLKNYKKGVIMIAMTVQLLAYIGTGIPGIKMFFLLSLLSLGLFFVNSKQLSCDKYPQYIKWATLLFLCSFSVTLYSSDFMHWETVIVNAVCYFAFPFLLWKCLDSPMRVNYALKLLLLIMSAGTLFGVIEAFTRKNLIFHVMEELFVFEDFYIDADTIRFGLKRCNSFFSYFSTYGIASYVSFIVFYVNIFMLNKKGAWQSVLVFLCAFGAFSTGSRAVFFGLFLACAMLLFRKQFIRSKKGSTFLAVAFITLPVILTIGYKVMDSMLNSDTSKYASGSSSDLRMMQWAACLPYFLESPIVGNGRMYIWEVVKAKHYELLGAESIWFSILVDYGLLGALAFLFLIFACAKHLARYNFRLICLPVGYLLILSLSPDTGITYNIVISFTILILRMFQFKKYNRYA